VEAPEGINFDYLIPKLFLGLRCFAHITDLSDCENLMFGYGGATLLSGIGVMGKKDSYIRYWFLRLWRADGLFEGSIGSLQGPLLLRRRPRR
jgi:hypothetical protein